MTSENEAQTNLGFLESFTGNDTVRMRKYISMFLSAAPAQAETIRTALAGADHEQVRASAHSLRPQMGYMGAKKGEHLLKRLEEDIKAGSFGNLRVMGAEFDTVFTQIVEELQAYLEKNE